MPKAKTTIQIGQDDGSVKTISAGEDVSGVDEDTMQQLRDAGAIETEEEEEDHGQVVGEMPSEEDQKKEAEKLAAQQTTAKQAAQPKAATAKTAES